MFKDVKFEFFPVLNRGNLSLLFLFLKREMLYSPLKNG